MATNGGGTHGQDEGEKRWKEREEREKGERKMTFLNIIFQYKEDASNEKIDR